MTDPGAALQRDRTRLVALLAGLLWVVLLTGGQVALGGRLVVVPWLALGPLGASLLLTWRGTAAVAVAGVLAVALLSRDTGDLHTFQGVVRVLGSAALASFAVFSAVVRVRREARVRRVTEVAVVAQAAILHPVPTQIGGLVLASRYVSATSDALVGGDLFDAVALEGGVRVIVGDARGKGLTAVRTSASVLSAFRHSAPDAGLGLDDVARRIDAAIAPHLDDEDFVTAVLCEVHADGRLDVVRCGHPPPLRLSPGAPPAALDGSSGPPLGLGVDPRVERYGLGRDERLLLYTDGLVEARDPSGRFFDLLGAVQQLGATGPPVAEALDHDLERLFGLLRRHVGGTLDDDVAALLLAPLHRAASVSRGLLPVARVQEDGRAE